MGQASQVFRAFLFLSAIYVGIQIGSLFASPSSIISPSDWIDQSNFVQQALPVSLIHQDWAERKRSTKNAREIVERAYNETYRILETCPNDLSLKSLQRCIVDIYNQQNVSSDLPWWFRSMLRDAREDFLHSQFHNLTFYKPSIAHCAMEKVGSTEWRKVRCAVNDNRTQTSAVCWAQNKRLKPPLAQTVFLRDPLTRFLSAFIDKCVTARDGRHCEPDRLFWYEENSMKKPGKGQVMHRDHKLMDDFFKDKRMFFQMYTEVIGLKWNVHFFPQSLYCNGLFRTIQNYEFVGNMNATFKYQLEDMGNKFGEPLKSWLPVIFQEKHPNKTKDNSRSEESSYFRNQKASKKLLEYYTPRTLRRVLEYVSIDYVKLNLPIPEWVDELLASEDTI